MKKVLYKTLRSEVFL